MAWTTPKTNWVNGEHFNVSDYNRIGENLLYLISLGEEMYPKFTDVELEWAYEEGFPTVSYFNNVVDATQAMLTHCYSPKGARSMRGYSSNGLVWNATELNAIENNLLLLYRAFTGQKSVIPRLQLTLGGVEIGSQTVS